MSYPSNQKNKDKIMRQLPIHHVTIAISIPLLIVALSNKAFSYGKEPCEDIPGHYARDDGSTGSIQVRVWILDAPNIDYEKTLKNLVSNAYYNRSDYYAECTSGYYTHDTIEGKYKQLTCTNKYGQRSSDEVVQYNVLNSYFEIPIQNGLTVKLEPKESRTSTWCKLGKQATFRTGALFAPRGGGSLGKSFFSITIYPMSPFTVHRNDPTTSDYKF